MIRITSGIIGVAVACVLWNTGGAVARDIDKLAMFTGSYIGQARACKADEWKPALRESIIQVQKWEPGNDLKYFRLVVEWANRYEARDCDQTGLLAHRLVQRAYLDSFIRGWKPGCNFIPVPDFVC
jgi:hypothetical protein